MNKSNTIKQSMIIFLLIICMFISMMSLIFLLLKDFKDYNNLLLLLYIVSTPMVFVVFYYLIKKSMVDIVNDTKLILEIKIDKQVWLEHVKKDYQKSIFMTIIICFLIAVILFFLLKGLYKEEPIVFFVLLNLFLPLLLPMIIVFGRVYIEKIVSNLFSKEYIIKFYPEGIFVNKWLFPLKFYHWRSQIYIKEIKTGVDFIEFTAVSTAFWPSMEGASGDVMKISKLKIPITDAKQIELLKKSYRQHKDNLVC